jgi:ribosomal protein L9
MLNHCNIITKSVSNMNHLFRRNFSRAVLPVKLTTDVQNVGLNGEVVNASVGFVRNYLLPKKLAVYVSKAEIKMKAKITDPVLIAAEQQKSEALLSRKRFDELKGVLSSLPRFVSYRTATTSTSSTSNNGQVRKTNISARPITTTKILWKLRALGLVDLKPEDISFAEPNPENKNDTARQTMNIFGDHIVNVKVTAFGHSEIIPFTYSLNPPMASGGVVEPVVTTNANQKAFRPRLTRE